MTWTLDDLPDQTGRTALVTGATGGLGHQVCLALARRGATVVLAARNEDKLAATARSITDAVPGAEVSRLRVDLADLSDVRRAAGAAVALGPVHLLINNAGVMATAQQRTIDGLDLQLATNHFGPFLLTCLLLPQLAEAEHGRVVTVSSNAHRMTRQAPLAEPRLVPARYSRWATYGQSKLANLLFTYELDRRLRAAGSPVLATAAHPGYSATHLLATGQTGGTGGALASILDATMRATGQSAAMGALPILMAATADVPGGTYCGPAGLGQWRGLPQIVTSSSLAHDPAAQAELWRISEAVTGVRFP
ncbi:Short-chain dehydrogenase/reductase SDR [metagenome]|uniref:Short-chain dehydrogenase/reductase SDR n=1 Tax=metagenome TaxID=256318 RepID=A0A2P2BYK6_9ZZZZ